MLVSPLRDNGAVGDLYMWKGSLGNRVKSRDKIGRPRVISTMFVVTFSGVVENASPKAWD
jgi:hypothetical protein